MSMLLMLLRVETSTFFSGYIVMAVHVTSLHVMLQLIKETFKCCN